MRELSRPWQGPCRSSWRKGDHCRLLRTPAETSPRRLSPLPRRDSKPVQHPAFLPHRQRRRLYELSFHSQISGPQIPAGLKTGRPLLHLSRQCSSAVLDALQTPCQRRVHDVYGLPQSSRRAPTHLAHGLAAPHDRPVARQRVGLLKMPLRETRPVCLRACSRSRRGLRNLPLSSRLHELPSPAPSRGFHDVPGMPQWRR